MQRKYWDKGGQQISYTAHHKGEEEKVHHFGPEMDTYVNNKKRSNSRELE